MPAAAAAAIAAAIWRIGAAFVPGFVSLPSGETKIAFFSVPSIPSQFESTKERSGASGAPGWIAGSFGAQSSASTTPSPSRSDAVAASAVVVVVVVAVVTVAAGRCPCALVAANV